MSASDAVNRLKGIEGKTVKPSHYTPTDWVNQSSGPKQIFHSDPLGERVLSGAHIENDNSSKIRDENIKLSIERSMKGYVDDKHVEIHNKIASLFSKVNIFGSLAISIILAGTLTVWLAMQNKFDDVIARIIKLEVFQELMNPKLNDAGGPPASNEHNHISAEPKKKP